MYCAHCGQENDTKSKFCMSCGSPLEAESLPEETGQQPEIESAVDEAASGSEKKVVSTEKETVEQRGQAEEQPAQEPILAKYGEFLCPHCGTGNEADALFCLSCGFRFAGKPEGDAAPDKKHRFSLKAYIIGAAVLVLLVAAFFFVPRFSSGDGNYIKASASPFTYFDNDGTFYVGSSNGKIVHIDDMLYAPEIQSGFKGDKTFVLTGEGDLYYYHDNDVRHIADGVYDFQASADGNAAIYLIDGDDRFDLFLYRDNEAKHISSEVDEDYICISPDGRAVGYISDFDDSHGSCKGYIWHDSHAESLGKNKFPIAVSNKGTYVYYQKYSSAQDSSPLYVQKGIDDDSREKICDDWTMLYLNHNGSQAVAIDRSEKIYISIQGSERIKLSSNYAHPVMPNDTISFCRQVFTCNGHYGEVAVLGIKKFAETCWAVIDSNKIAFLDRNYSFTTVAKKVEDFFLSDNGKTVYYQKGDSIHQINANKAGSNDITLVEDDVSSFAISNSGKKIYYVTVDNEVFSQTGTKKPVRLSDEIFLNNNGLHKKIYHGKTLFYVNDGELYSSSGGKRIQISGFKGNVVSVSSDFFSVVVNTIDDGDRYIYYSTDGKSFALVAES